MPPPYQEGNELEDDELPPIQSEANDAPLDPDANNPTVDPDYSASEAEAQGEDEDSESDHEQQRREAPTRGRGRPRGRTPKYQEDTWGRRPRGRRGKLGRPRKERSPGPEYKTLVGKAVTSRIEERYEDAANFARQALQYDRDIFFGHSLLSDILYHQGKHEQSVHALLVGAHTTKDKAIWHSVAERTLELPGGDKWEKLKQALYCYEEITKIDRDDQEARERKKQIYIEQGALPKARRECESLLENRPYDVDLLKELADICTELGAPYQAIQAYEKAIKFWSSKRFSTDSPFDWSMLNIYMDLMDSRENFAEQAIPQLKQFARWLVGRQDETYWDAQRDDREWDIEDLPRRIVVGRFIPKRYPKDTYGESLPLELRVKLGMFRLRLGPQHYPEALLHFQVMEPEKPHNPKVEDYYDLFREIAEALQDAGQHRDSLRFYLALQQLPGGITDPAFFYSVAACYMDIGNSTEAERYFRIPMARGNKDPAAKLKLAQLYDSIGAYDQGTQLIHEVKQMNRRDLIVKAGLNGPRPGEPIKTVSRLPAIMTEGYKKAEIADKTARQQQKRDKRAEGLARREVHETEAERYELTQQLYEQLQALEADADAGDSEEACESYMDVAEEILEDFVSSRHFYQRDKYKPFTGYGKVHDKSGIIKDLRTDAPGDVPNDFRDVSFQGWLDIICRYALLLARAGRKADCSRMISFALEGNVFYHNKQFFTLAQATRLSCAIILQDEKEIVDQIRLFIKEAPDAANVYRLASHVHRLYHGPRTWYNCGPMQKNVLRLLKMFDYALLDPVSRGQWPFTQQELISWTESAKHEGNPWQLQELNVGVLMLYGHMMLLGGTTNVALDYYFRVFAVKPEDPVVSLCIANAFVQSALKRISENRHFQIQQGLAFLWRYYELRARPAGGARALHRQEAEFNVGRVYHGLGMEHLALGFYEKCLALRGEVVHERENGEPEEDFAVEAAFAVGNIRGAGGDVGGARRMAEEWMVL